MFSKASKSHAVDRQQASGRPVPSIISADLSITGDLASSGEIQIDGAVEGDIQCSVLIVGVNGSVTGEIKAETVRLHGRVTGQVRAATVFLAATARMIGDVTHESLAIEPGAFMEGHCRRMTDSAALESRKGDLKLANASKGDGKVDGLLADKAVAAAAS
ncbi:polymer-forming cytoskeletal protein [Novispirillum itersonii subsp. nipponicum]|uniref:Cytoskeletal protein CcmA (Bactofilin family) n=1 Tax=Novispirillum itersonii TaxID=189 RepID=A0A7W9ZEP9_NOVIT|nr:polymer-forming cytoskeletal protein [Novispirillum itersonii]MBB6210111.1 cytoskeletal protein CcmA (bactofilin family) [Novispirillum itersonii]